MREVGEVIGTRSAAESTDEDGRVEPVVMDAAVLKEVGEAIGASDAVGSTDEAGRVEPAVMDSAALGEVGEVIGARDAAGPTNEAGRVEIEDGAESVGVSAGLVAKRMGGIVKTLPDEPVITDSEGEGAVRRKVTAATLDDDDGPLVAGRRVEETRMTTPGTKGKLELVASEFIEVVTPEEMVIRTKFEEVINGVGPSRVFGGPGVKVATGVIDGSNGSPVARDSEEGNGTATGIDAVLSTGRLPDEIEGANVISVSIGGVGASVGTGCEGLDVEFVLANGGDGEIVMGPNAVLEFVWRLMLLGETGGEEGAWLTLKVPKTGTIVTMETETPGTVDVAAEQSERVADEPQYHSCTTEQPHSSDEPEPEQIGTRGRAPQPAAYGSRGHSQGM